MMRPIAIVTGGSSNIGWACARRLAATHDVVIADLKPPAEALPAGARFVATNITAPDGLCVNAVVPGSMEGAMIPRERGPEIAARIPLGSLGTPEKVAGNVAWLCTEPARYVTSHALDVNGGSWLSQSAP